MATPKDGKAFLLALAESANPEIAVRLRRAAASCGYSAPRPASPVPAPVPVARPAEFRWQGVSNKLERDYSLHLCYREGRGELLWAGCNLMRLRIGAGNFYKPDFVVVHPSGMVEFHETKGFWREAARVRIRTASALYPFAFLGVTRKGGAWCYERFGLGK